MGAVCSALTGKGVHEPKVVRHGVKGEHAVVVNKHDRNHPNQVQQLLTATFDEPEESGITAPVLASGHTAKKHFHIDANGHAHHSFVKRNGAKPKQEWEKRQSVDVLAGRKGSGAFRTLSKRRRRASLPLFINQEDDEAPHDGLISAGLVAMAMEEERRNGSAFAGSMDRRRSSTAASAKKSPRSFDPGSRRSFDPGSRRASGNAAVDTGWQGRGGGARRPSLGSGARRPSNGSGSRRPSIGSGM